MSYIFQIFRFFVICGEFLINVLQVQLNFIISCSKIIDNSSYFGIFLNFIKKIKKLF